MIRSLALKADAPTASSAAGDLGRLAGAVAALPTLTRAILVLHRFERLPLAEIGGRLGLSEDVVREHIAEAMSRLVG